MARNASRLKLGYYPLVSGEVPADSSFPRISDGMRGTRSLCRDGRGTAADHWQTQARRYGIELDSFRAMEAGRVLDEVVQGSVFDTHCAVESYSLLYLNPPLS